MDTIKRIFPLSFNADTLVAFVKTLVTYLVLDIVSTILIGILGKLPLIGIVFGLIGSLLGAYFTIGLILTILVFVGVIR